MAGRRRRHIRATSSTYILVAADAGKVIKVRVSFTDDDGNTETLTSAATAAVVALGPDLASLSLIFIGNSSNVYVGATFTLNVGLQNRGGGASAATTLRYYQSTDATIDTSDTEVGTDDVAALSASASASVSKGLTAPDTAGTYHYGACVDAVAGESDTTNNCSSGFEILVLTWNSPATGQPTISGTPRAGRLSGPTHREFPTLMAWPTPSSAINGWQTTPTSPVLRDQRTPWLTLTRARPSRFARPSPTTQVTTRF